MQIVSIRSERERVIQHCSGDDFFFFWWKSQSFQSLSPLSLSQSRESWALLVQLSQFNSQGQHFINVLFTAIVVLHL